MKKERIGRLAVYAVCALLTVVAFLQRFYIL